MDTIARVGLIAFILYLPVFLMLLFLAVKRYKEYSFTSLWMSNLGDTRHQSSVLFNSGFLLYGLLSLFFVNGLSRILPNMLIPTVAILFLYICSFSTIVASLIPMNKNLNVHHKFSNMVFMSITAFSALLIYPISVSNIISRYFLVLNVILIVLSVVLSVSFARLVKKTGKIPISLFEIRKTEKCFIVRNAAVQEWIFFLVVIVWNFVMSLIILQNLHI
ncbi:DUF998 domain-containing protein [Patescibacteria group bacterium]|nr:DUF998 domain-containing protein [Patescibacteria group bacterium]